MKSLLYHDDSDNDLERQVTELTKNQLQYNLAVTIMTNQFRLLQAAISEQA
jgi:flagellar basal-body rod protein FlgB